MLDLFPTFKKKVYFFGNIEKCPLTCWLNGRWFLQIVDIGNFNMEVKWKVVFPHSRQWWESISNIYITKIVVLASEAVGGRSRATELPCLIDMATQEVPIKIFERNCQSGFLDIRH